MMPVVGLGVALTAEMTYDAVQWAFAQGYRLIDTAAEESYGNEDSVGAAVRAAVRAVAKNDNSTFANIQSRQDVFVTSKLWDSDHGFYEALDAFDESHEVAELSS